MATAARRIDGLNPYKAPRDDKREECVFLKRRIKIMKTAAIKTPDEFSAEFIAELEAALEVMQAELVVLMAQARAFKVPPPKPHKSLPASWAV
ncbi:MAG: hypothetical protein JWS10_635 [Cypionkella sp.]|uniref:hypothetical protein n=1 Tax=Cypionkella sp. TaxID=2811411 RepID=UPI0026394AA2|nr:hypothetical protein [Cypionkella sp.]MDB5658020.1 hypothetical protein [Cypionkella sp.]